MTNYSAADLRLNYTRGGLLESEADRHPMKLFETWFKQAIEAELPEPNGMTLATVGLDGRPAARIVLLKGLGPEGLVFYTNYESRKGEELAAHPWGALVFWWPELERQVRIEGAVERISTAQSDQYFYSRPLGSRLGAWASEQSRVIGDRTILEDRLAAFQAQYADGQIPRPAHWGGFRLIPDVMEFWQGRPSRLHDRLRYRLTEMGVWECDRLAP
ncbi:pyridoxamine 5'-phosphate oxidase [Spirulina sp. CCNP1310]|uniref:pyridoxamine 5'-phosphate oxidase n=1 Tax=Spirulina sp. CCNP1310 TaxID=3110249 RepID=UPI002B1EC1D5|nr:pyridoxamine 5'-phosphate oxidase [Spirulina sp. CCNP1310]MEA5418863.1 pyridoxamine 5'-phosphate oxidase [Spirulina sp. CCNP1310]